MTSYQRLFKGRPALLLAVWLASSAGWIQAQSAHLQIETIATETDPQNHMSGVSTGSNSNEVAAIGSDERVYHRSETLKITLTNMSPSPDNFEVIWHFLAKDVATKVTHVFEKGTNLIALAGGSSTNFEVASKPVPEIQKYYLAYDIFGDSGAMERNESGAKPAGYVFLVKARGKLIEVEASDRDLKEKYQKRLIANTLVRPPP